MARLCIRKLAKPVVSTLSSQAGDVICVVEDGHEFTTAELTNGHYRIIDVAGVSASEFANLIASSFNANGTLFRLRAVGLNVTTLNTTWANKTTATKAEITAITVTK